MPAFLVNLLILVFIGIAAGQVTGTGSVVGVLLGLPVDVLQAIFLPELSATRAFALDLVVDELEKAAREAIEQHDEDDEDTEKRLRTLQRQNPDVTYLWGEISVKDLAIFGGSSLVLTVPEIEETVFQVASGLL